MIGVEGQPESGKGRHQKHEQRLRVPARGVKIVFGDVAGDSVKIECGHHFERDKNHQDIYQL